MAWRSTWGFRREWEVLTSEGDDTARWNCLDCRRELGKRGDVMYWKTIRHVGYNCSLCEECAVKKGIVW